MQLASQLVGLELLSERRVELANSLRVELGPELELEHQLDADFDPDPHWEAELETESELGFGFSRRRRECGHVGCRYLWTLTTHDAGDSRASRIARRQDARAHGGPWPTGDIDRVFN